MLIPPRPVMPYWPAYPEPERSRLEAAYREEERKWQREATLVATFNLAMALIGPAMIGAAAVFILSLTWPG